MTEPGGRFEAVLFDAGDTLIRLRGSGETLLHRAAATLGPDPLEPAAASRVWRRVLARSGTADELAKGRDLSAGAHRAVWTALYRESGCDELRPGLSDELYAATVRAESWEPFSDAEPTLRAVARRGLRVGVLSDTGFDLRPALERAGLARHLDDVALSCETGVCKPAAEAFLTACRQLEADPARTLMVGDNPLTDAGAVTAGLACYLLPPVRPDGPRGLAAVLGLL